MSKMKKKFSSEKGESILETLVALLIIVLSISFLSASIAKSASITNKIRKATEDGFLYDSISKSESKTISAESDLVSARDVMVYTVTTEAGEFYYYEPHSEG